MTEDRPVADGIVEKRPDGSTQVRFVRRLPHPIARVWAALTDPAARVGAGQPLRRRDDTAASSPPVA